MYRNVSRGHPPEEQALHPSLPQKHWLIIGTEGSGRHGLRGISRESEGVVAGACFHRRSLSPDWAQTSPTDGTTKPRHSYRRTEPSPTFTEEPTAVRFFAGFSSRGHTQLVPTRPRTENERKSPKNKLVLDPVQYVNEIMIPHILPLYKR